jgi:hypothetical protein
MVGASVRPSPYMVFREVIMVILPNNALYAKSYLESLDWEGGGCYSISKSGLVRLDYLGRLKSFEKIVLFRINFKLLRMWIEHRDVYEIAGLFSILFYIAVLTVLITALLK